MILVDANILLYAYNTSSEFHSRARSWLETAFEGPQPIRLAWATVFAFLRLTTHPRIFPEPFETQQAIEIVDGWLKRSTVEPLVAGPAYWSILSRLLEETGVRGAKVMDVELAALAIEHGATLYTADHDFNRFEGLQVRNPLTAG